MTKRNLATLADSIHTYIRALERMANSQPETWVDNTKHDLEDAQRVVEFYANHNYWMSASENGDAQLLTAHGAHFDGASSGWVEAEQLLKRLDARNPAR